MKTVNIPIKVEDWVEWVAQDADGYIHGYSYEPIEARSSWYSTLSSTVICSADPNPNWRETKRRAL